MNVYSRIHKSHKKLRKAGLTGLQSVAWGSSPRLPRALLARHRESCSQSKLVVSRKRHHFVSASEDPIDISDSSGNAVEPDKKIPLNPEEVVELFRLDMSKLRSVSYLLVSTTLLTGCRNRKEVQLLYFPMIEPLTNDERERCKSVIAVSVNDIVPPQQPIVQDTSSLESVNDIVPLKN